MSYNGKQLILAAKAGAYGEYVAERLYNRYAKKPVNRFTSRMYQRARRTWRRPYSSMFRRTRRPPVYARRRRLVAVRPRKRPRTVKRYDIGYPRGASSSQQNATVRDVAPLPLDTKRIHSIELTKIGRNSVGDTGRRAETMYCTGFKICCELNSLASDKMYFNMALVTYKNDMGDTNKFAPGASNNGAVGQIVQEFFRDQGTDSGARSVAMSDDRSGIELHCLPINTDKYKILSHKRYKVGAAPNDNEAVLVGGGFNNGSAGPNQVTINRWVKLKRQLRYSGSANDTCENPIFLLMWCGLFNEAGPATNSIAAMTRHLRAITYFRNVQN